MSENIRKELVSLFTKKEAKTIDEFFMDTIEPHSRSQILRSGGNETKKVITVKERSMMFLLKKFFVYGMNGFSSFSGRMRSRWSEPRLGQIWRTILHKKIYLHWLSKDPASTAKKYIENGHAIEFEDEVIDWPESRGSKWDRTDSEYIVLEI